MYTMLNMGFGVLSKCFFGLCVCVHLMCESDSCVDQQGQVNTYSVQCSDREGQCPAELP